MNGLVQQMSNQLNNSFGTTVDQLKDGLDVLKAGKDVVSTVVKDVTGEDVSIQSIQQGAIDFDNKWDAFANQVNEKFNNTTSANQANILETFAKSHFGNDIYNLGSALKNELPGVLGGIADYKKAIDSFSSNSKTAEEAAKKITDGVNTIVQATQNIATSLNNAVQTCTGNNIPILTTLSNIGGSSAVTNLNKVLALGTSGATIATTAKQLGDAIKGKDLKGITDSMAKEATTINDLLTQLNNTIPGFTNAQIPSQITNSILQLQNGQAIYDAAGSMITALVADASGHFSIGSFSTLTTHFDQNWDTFSAKIDALFRVTPGNGQQAVLETLAKSMFGENVFYTAGAIKRQLPGVLGGITGVQDALKQFGGSYRNPIEAATKIKNGVEKMVQAVEKIGESLNNIVKYYQGKGNIANGTGYPILDTLANLGDTKGIKALDTAIRIGGGSAAVLGNAGAVAQALKNKDLKGAVSAIKKTIDDVKRLTKKGNYTSSSSGNTSTGGNKTSSTTNNGNNQQQSNPTSAAQSNSYVCSGATMRCTMGEKTAKLTVLPIRTIYLTGQPMANISDHVSIVNLAPFGKCRSLGYPATASATAAHHGVLTPMPCSHNTPMNWMPGKNDYLVKGQPALLKTSKCHCMWGGMISLVTDGQTSTGPVDLSRITFETIDDWDASLERLEMPESESVLDGLQLGLSVAGFVPGLGAIPDLLNAAISATRGNWTDAGLSVLAAVPLIGDAAAGVRMVKLGVNTAKTAKISNAIRKGEKVRGEIPPTVVNKVWKKMRNYDSPPYKLGGRVQSIELTENSTFVRVYNKNQSRMEGQWVMRREDIKGLTPKEIKNRYALPEEPNYMCEVELPKGTRMHKGTANKVNGWGEGGGIQYDLRFKDVGQFRNESIINGKI